MSHILRVEPPCSGWGRAEEKCCLWTTNTWRSPGLRSIAALCLCTSRGGKKETHTVSPQKRSSCWHPCFLFPLFLIFLSARMPWLVICLSRQCFPVCHFPVNTIKLWKLSWRSKTITRFVSLYMLEAWQGRIVRRQFSVWKLGASSPKWPLHCSYTVCVVFSRQLETHFQAFLFTLWQKCSQRKLNIELWWLHSTRTLWEVALSALFELSGSETLEVNVTERNNLLCLVLHRRKIPRSHFRQQQWCEDLLCKSLWKLFWPHRPPKTRVSVVTSETRDDYSHVMGSATVSEQSAQLDINCLGVKSCFQWWLCDARFFPAWAKKTGLRIQNNHVITK